MLKTTIETKIRELENELCMMANTRQAIMGCIREIKRSQKELEGLKDITLSRATLTAIYDNINGLAGKAQRYAELVLGEISPIPYAHPQIGGEQANTGEVIVHLEHLLERFPAKAKNLQLDLAELCIDLVILQGAEGVSVKS